MKLVAKRRLTVGIWRICKIKNLQIQDSYLGRWVELKLIFQNSWKKEIEVNEQD